MHNHRTPDLVLGLRDLKAEARVGVHDSSRNQGHTYILLPFNQFVLYMYFHRRRAEGPACIQGPTGHSTSRSQLLVSIYRFVRDAALRSRGMH